MGWSKGIRQFHRWVSVVFTLTVAANFAAMAIGEGQPPAAVTYSPLPFLFLLLLSGMYLFVLPYTAKARSERRA
jgi:hypothetical protein